MQIRIQIRLYRMLKLFWFFLPQIAWAFLCSWPQTGHLQNNGMKFKVVWDRTSAVRSQSQLWPSLGDCKIIAFQSKAIFLRSPTHMLAVIYCLTYLSLHNLGQNPGSFLCKPCNCSAAKPCLQLMGSFRQVPSSLRLQPLGTEAGKGKCFPSLLQRVFLSLWPGSWICSPTCGWLSWHCHLKQANSLRVASFYLLD